jgi:NitT/TauT family transport system substrate-binding protein/putative hydroxymethylpyrimidine transport system substrate-binding protein
LLLLVLLAATGCGDDGGPAAQRASVALDFTPNAAHAGIFQAALDPAEGGVRLEPRPPSASTDSLRLLATGRADLAVVDIQDLGLARQRGADVVGVAAVVQRPLAAVIARPPVGRPRELEGRRVGVTGLPSDEAVLRAVVEADGGDPRRVERRTIGFSAVPSLVSGRVAAATAFWNAEGVALRERGEPTREFRVGDYGAPPYPELVLCTTAAKLRRDPELIRGAVEALRRGTAAALRDPGPALARIATRSGAEPELVRAQYRAIRPALSPPARLDRRALAGWARFAVRFGILDRPPDLGAAFPQI